MAIIAIASSKGGVGKTTLSAVLAGELAHAGAEVRLLDADPNKPLTAWKRITGEAGNIGVIGDVSEETIQDQIDQAAAEAAFVIIDLEGSANYMISQAIARSDLVLVPVQGSQLDGAEAAKALKLISNVERMSQRPIPRSAILSRTSAAIRPRTLKYVEEQLRTLGFPVMNAQLIDRDAFRAIFALGGTVRDLTAADTSNPSAAVQNAEAIASEVVELLRSTRQQAAE